MASKPSALDILKKARAKADDKKNKKEKKDRLKDTSKKERKKDKANKAEMQEHWIPIESNPGHLTEILDAQSVDLSWRVRARRLTQHYIFSPWTTFVRFIKRCLDPDPDEDELLNIQRVERDNH